MKRRDMLAHTTLAVFGASLPLASTRAQDRFSRYRGQVVRMSIPVHPHYDAMLELLPVFTRESGIKVEVDRLPIPKMKERQLAELAKPQSIFDLACYVVMWKSEYVRKNLVHELDTFLKNPALADPAFDMADIAPNYLENLGLVGGWRGYLAGPTAKLYGLPYGAETSILAYRTDIFAKHGLVVPATYFELEHLLPLLRDKSGIGALSSRGRVGHQCVHAWLLHLNPIGGKVFNLDWSARANDAKGLRALELLKLVIETGPKDAVEFDQSAMMNAFLQGEAAMYLDSTVIFGAVRDPQQSKIVGKVAYARHPKAYVHASQSGGLGLAIPRTARNAEAGFLLMQWLTSKAQDKAVCRLGGAPTRLSTLQDEALTRQYPEYLTMRSQIQDASPDWRPIIAEWDEINTQALGTSIGDALHGKVSSQQALDGANQKIAAIMRRSGYKG
ncbi:MULTISPECIES: ABC transporter substrate-binding protein [unclassified Variovorax]|uniref:ABC transporter substrate-binding protein n=1 Tax=unclassified Variovorax TaxID=663243 RepID=UPI003F475680